MADIDTSIALKVQTPNMMNTLGNIASTAGALQQVKQGQMDLEERNKLRDLSKNLGQYKTEDGGLDMNRLVNDAVQTSPKLGAQWATQIAGAHAEGIAVNGALNTLSEQQRNIMGQTVMSVADQPYDVKEKVIGAVVQANPRLKVWGDMALKHLKGVANDPEASKQVAFQIAKGTVGVPTQNQLSTPNYMDTGGKKINTNPMAGGPQQITNTFPRTSKGIDPNTGAEVYLNPDGSPAKDNNSGAIGNPRSVQANLSPTESGIAHTVNQDYAKRISSATEAQRNMGVLQNMQHYAEGAITGVGTDRRSWVAGLAGILGMPEEQLAKTNTDLLMKNEKMLALAGGDTNLAKTLAESANPNVKMTPEAIQKAARQVIAQQQIHIEGSRYLGQFLGDYKTYNKELNEWNKHADPRILELPNMTKAEREKMKDGMSPAQAHKFSESVQYMQDRGILK